MVLLLLCVNHTACGLYVGFIGERTVDESGTLTRITRYDICGDSLPAAYAPQNGVWVPYARMTVDSAGRGRVRECRELIAVARFAGGVAIPADFVRNASYVDGAATNDISIDVGNWFFVRTFHYEERFRDIVTVESLADVATLYAEDWRRFLREDVRAEVSRHVDADSLVAAFDATIGAEIKRNIASLERDGLEHVYAWLEIAEVDGFDHYFDRFLSEIIARTNEGRPPDDYIRELESGEAGKPATGEALEEIVIGREELDLHLESWLDLLRQAVIDDFHESFMLRFPEAELNERVFGAHGFALFDTYAFDLELEMPGRVYDSNGLEAGGRHLWKFRYEEFIWREYVASATSIRVYWLRIVGVLAVLVMLALFARAYRTRSA